MATTYTPAEIALDFDTDSRTVRKFLRSADGLDMKVGKGQRWAVEAKNMRGLRSRFNKWVAAQEAAKQDDSPEGADA